MFIPVLWMLFLTSLSTWLLPFVCLYLMPTFSLKLFIVIAVILASLIFFLLSLKESYITLPKKIFIFLLWISVNITPIIFYGCMFYVGYMDMHYPLGRYY